MGASSTKNSYGAAYHNPITRMYCIHTGLNTFIVNHLILQDRNLRKLEKNIIVGTATPSKTFTVRQIFDVSQLLEMRFCSEASASLLPSDIINDGALEVHVYKINGQHECTLSSRTENLLALMSENLFSMRLDITECGGSLKSRCPTLSSAKAFWWTFSYFS